MGWHLFWEFGIEMQGIAGSGVGDGVRSGVTGCRISRPRTETDVAFRLGGRQLEVTNHCIQLCEQQRPIDVRTERRGLLDCSIRDHELIDFDPCLPQVVERSMKLLDVFQTEVGRPILGQRVAERTQPRIGPQEAVFAH